MFYRDDGLHSEPTRDAMEPGEVRAVEGHKQVHVSRRALDAVEVDRNSADEDIPHALVMHGSEELDVEHAAAV
jgi:hypothetical protein